ncbi:MAG: hypothetical protein ACOH2M_18590 [Cypionkella sp.]
MTKPIKPFSQRVQKAFDDAYRPGESLSQRTGRVGAALRTPEETREFLAAIKAYEAKEAPLLKPGQARRFKSKIAKRNAFTDLLAMAHVEGRS